MIYLKKFNESKENIASICQRYNIKNYIINDDVTIDVNGDVNLLDKKLTKIPLKFRSVSGNFYCHYNQLTTLEGAPQTVGGNFYCTNNKLTTLEEAPRKVGRDFSCSYNQLTTLEGVPQTIHGDFACGHNKLTTLEGAPTTVSGYFYCAYNQLTTLEGAPKTIGGVFLCNYNKLVNLEFASSCKVLSCSNNPIHKWWVLVNDTSKLGAFIDLGIDARDTDFMNREKINLLLE